MNPYSDLPFALHVEGFAHPFYADCDPHSFTHRESLIRWPANGWGLAFSLFISETSRGAS